MSEYEIEPIPGLPEPLPPGETILWQGAPGWSALSRHSFYLRELVAYFAILLVWYAGQTLIGGERVSSVALTMTRLIGVSALAIGVVAVYALLVNWTTLYTVTSRRIVIRSGIALPTVVNIPYTSVQSAGLKTFRDESGNILLSLVADQRLAYLVLWPNVRMTGLSRVEPMLRGIADARGVARTLANALAAATSQPPQALPDPQWASRPVDTAHRPGTAAA
jgi:hypothetical protein